MPDKSLKERLLSHDFFYSVMYTGVQPEYDGRFIKVSSRSVKFSEDGRRFYWEWGMTGYNSYSDATYGREWAYDKQVLLDYWGL